MAAKSVVSEVSGFCQRANYRPVEISIQKLSPAAGPDATSDLEDGAAVIQVTDDFGVPVEEYIYFIDGSAETPAGVAGWYSIDAGGNKIYSDKVFGPGEGFIYQAPYFENDDEEEVASVLVFAE